MKVFHNQTHSAPIDMAECALLEASRILILCSFRLAVDMKGFHDNQPKEHKICIYTYSGGNCQVKNG